MQARDVTKDLTYKFVHPFVFKMRTLSDLLLF